MQRLAFKTKTSDRWGDVLSPEGILDMALRGTEAQWWELYAAVEESAELRKLLKELLKNADPDLEGGIRLWTSILNRFENRTAMQ